MKKNILLLLFAFCLMAVKAQDISVKSFELLPNDLTAITNGTMETDQNGEVASLIKVITSEKGFLFDGGMMGIVKVVQKVGEIWVYVPHGLNHISISHQQLGKLRDYYFPVAIEKARTYELVLTTAKIKTTLEEDAGGGYVAFDISPADATVYIDDMKLNTNEDGTLSVFLTYGPHEYRVEADGYKPASGQVEVSSEETQPLEITLRSVMATVTLTTDMPEAEIWANNKLLGKGTWTGGLPAGTYAIETRRDGHRPRSTTASFAEKEVKTITLEAPVPVYGRLRAESKPSGAEVVIDGKVIGKTPGIFDNVLFGTRTPLFRKEGYADTTAVVTIEEGKISAVSVEMRKAEKKDIQTPNSDGSSIAIVRRNPYPSKSIYVDGFIANSNFDVDLYYGGGDVGIRLSGFNAHFAYERGIWDNTLHNGFGVSLGYDIKPHSRFSDDNWGLSADKFCLTPCIGIGIINYKYDESYNSSIPSFSGITGNASIRAEYALSPIIHLFTTLRYDIPLTIISPSDYWRININDRDAIRSKFYSDNYRGFFIKLGLSLNIPLQK